jgi:hypothetical protein
MAVVVMAMEVATDTVEDMEGVTGKVMAKVTARVIAKATERKKVGARKKPLHITNV